MILRDGIDRATVRNVASEAGWSAGALRHYFLNKDDLLAAATRFLTEATAASTEQSTEQVSNGPALQDATRAALCSVLALDEPRREKAAAWLVLAGCSLVDCASGECEALLDAQRRLYLTITHELAEASLLPVGCDPEAEAARLHALVDGLNVHVLTGRVRSDAALKILDDHLAGMIRWPSPP